MRNTWLKVIVSTSALVVIICIVLVIYVMKPIIFKNDINESERIEKKPNLHCFCFFNDYPLIVIGKNSKYFE